VIRFERQNPDAKLFRSQLILYPQATKWLPGPVITKIKAKLPKKLHRNFARMVTDLLLFFAKDMQKKIQ